MTAVNLSVESIDAKLSYLFERFERQHRAVCEIQQRLVNLESAPDIVSSCSDFSETAS